MVTLCINHPRIEVNMKFRNLRYIKYSRDTLKTLKSSGSTSSWDFVIKNWISRTFSYCWCDQNNCFTASGKSLISSLSWVWTVLLLWYWTMYWLQTQNNWMKVYRVVSSRKKIVSIQTKKNKTCSVRWGPKILRLVLCG